MFAFLQGRISERKLWLLGSPACAWPGQVAFRRQLACAEAEERYADGLATADEVIDAWRRRVIPGADAFVTSQWVVAGRAWGNALENARDAIAMLGGKSDLVVRRAIEAAQCDLIRDIAGDPFRPIVPDARWRTNNVLALARGVYDDRAFDRLPILADAMMDAGCEDDLIIEHCRGEGPHVRGCWVVDLVLGKEEAEPVGTPDTGRVIG